LGVLIYHCLWYVRQEKDTVVEERRDRDNLKGVLGISIYLKPQ